MRKKLKLIIAIALFIILIAGYEYLKKNDYRKTASEPISMTPPQSTPEKSLETVKSFDPLRPPAKELDGDLTEHQIEMSSLVDMGYSEATAEAMLAGKSISAHDMPEPLKSSVLDDLAKEKKYGYQPMNEEDLDPILNIENHLSDNKSASLKEVDFKPSQLPNILLTQFRYAGAEDVLEPDTLKRVFKKLNSNSTIIIEEISRKNFTDYPTKEFINERIGKHEARYAVIKSPSGRSYTYLTWSGKNYAYTINQFGETIPREQLIKLGEELESLNNK